MFDNSTFSITFNGENPFDTNGFPARWELGEPPRLILLNTHDLIVHCFDPLISVWPSNSDFICGLLVEFGRVDGRFDGGIDDFGCLLNNDHIIQWFWSRIGRRICWCD